MVMVSLLRFVTYSFVWTKLKLLISIHDLIAQLSYIFPLRIVWGVCICILQKLYPEIKIENLYQFSYFILSPSIVYLFFVGFI